MSTRTIIRLEKRDPGYSQISNNVLNDSRLSFRARGILSCLLSKPSNWQTNEEYLVNNSPGEGRTAIKTAMKELLDLGYATRAKLKDNKGRFQGWLTIIREVPVPPRKEKTDIGQTDIGSYECAKEKNHNSDNPRNFDNLYSVKADISDFSNLDDFKNSADPNKGKTDIGQTDIGQTEIGKSDITNNIYEKIINSTTTADFSQPDQQGVVKSIFYLPKITDPSEAAAESEELVSYMMKNNLIEIKKSPEGLKRKIAKEFREGKAQRPIGYKSIRERLGQRKQKELEMKKNELEDDAMAAEQDRQIKLFFALPEIRQNFYRSLARAQLGASNSKIVDTRAVQLAFAAGE